MSRLLGIVNVKADPADPFNYWIWRASEVIPPAAEWDFERLAVYTTPAPDGNQCVWVCGPPTEKYRDGVFLKIFVGSELQPSPKTAEAEVYVPPHHLEVQTPLADMT